MPSGAGPCTGFPLGIKDIIDVQGLATGAGSPLCGHQAAAADAPLVAALRRAGAVILGKTVTVEFACFDPSPTRNPWNLAHTPGGSSSGSAAALAMGMCLGALGTQTGGSLVRPSTYCGVATCKPTFGKLSTEGIVPVSTSLDHAGPMARKVGDLALLLDCLLGVTTPRPLRPWGPPRLGAPRDNSCSAEADEAVRQATQSALEKLTHAGAEIQPLALPQMFGDVLKMHRRIMAVEAAAYHRERFASYRDQYGPMIASLLDEGLAIAAVDYVAAKAWHREFRRQAAELLDGFDALIMPSTHTTAPATLATTGTPHFQAPWSLARLPVVSIPCGVAADGMPTGIQLVGRWTTRRNCSAWPPGASRSWGSTPCRPCGVRGQNRTGRPDDWESSGGLFVCVGRTSILWQAEIQGILRPGTRRGRLAKVMRLKLA